MSDDISVDGMLTNEQLRNRELGRIQRDMRNTGAPFGKMSLSITGGGVGSQDSKTMEKISEAQERAIWESKRK